MTKEPGFTIKSKEEAFWEQELRLSLMQIDSIRKEQENGDKMIEIYENTMEFCRKKLNPRQL